MRAKRIVSIGIALGTLWAAVAVAAGAPGRGVVAQVGNIKWDPGAVTVRADSGSDSGADVVTDQVGNIKWEPLR